MTNRAAVILQAGEEILLLKRIRYGEEYWVIPGGGVEQGESLLECAVREIKEELEYEVKSSQLTFLCELENRGRQEIYYWSKIERREFEISGEEAERSSIDNIYIPQWIKVDNLRHSNLKQEVLVDIILGKLKSDES